MTRAARVSIFSGRLVGMSCPLGPNSAPPTGVPIYCAVVRVLFGSDEEGKLSDGVMEAEAYYAVFMKAVCGKVMGMSSRPNRFTSIA